MCKMHVVMHVLCVLCVYVCCVLCVLCMCCVCAEKVFLTDVVSTPSGQARIVQYEEQQKANKPLQKDQTVSLVLVEEWELAG